MMTFKRFLAEGTEFDFDKFKTDCAFMIDELKKSRSNGSSFLYRGGHSLPEGHPWEIRAYTERSAPRDSAPELHDRLNVVFTDMFGAPIRNWMFASGAVSQAGIYSQGESGLHAIFPIGKFEWVSGLDRALYDMTSFAAQIRSRLADAGKDLSWEERAKLSINMVTQKVRHMHWEHNTNLAQCLEVGNEIMIKCDKYYAVNVYSDLFEKQIKPFFKSL